MNHEEEKPRSLTSNGSQSSSPESNSFYYSPFNDEKELDKNVEAYDPLKFTISEKPKDFKMSKRTTISDDPMRRLTMQLQSMYSEKNR